MYKANVNVHRWNKDEVMSEQDLLSEGIIINDWVSKNLIIKMGETKSVNKKELNLDINNDGKVDSKDSRLASKVMNAMKRKKKKSRK